jgi:hypothetical protein
MSYLDEEFKEWFDSHKEPDGTIISSNHPDLCKYFNHVYNPKRISMDDLYEIKGLGDTVSFEIKEIDRSTP